jgi:hypothetical protein
VTLVTSRRTFDREESELTALLILCCKSLDQGAAWLLARRAIVIRTPTIAPKNAKNHKGPQYFRARPALPCQTDWAMTRLQ